MNSGYPYNQSYPFGPALLLSGGTMSGAIAMGANKVTGIADGTNPQDAVSLNQLNNAVASLTPKADCAAATTTALAAATYNNGSSGVGATLTLTVAAVLVLDGYTPLLGDRILVKNQAAPANNGLYAVTTLGTVLINAVLTRTTDFDQPAEIDGAITFIINGSTNAGTRWQCLASGAVTIGTTAINWSLFTGSTYSADGTTISLSGTTFALITPVAVANGGTGGTTATGTGAVVLATSPTLVTPALGTPSSGSLANCTGYPISFPTDFLSGQNACAVQYSSTTVIQVGTGSIYSPVDSAVLTISSPLTNTPTLGASTMYYVYLTAGGASLTVNSTAPATNYQGTAWKTAGGLRYLGCFLTDASSHIISFLRVGNMQLYQGTQHSNAPWRILTNGGSTTPDTVVSASAVVPKTSFILIAFLAAGSQAAYLSNSNGPSATTSSGLYYIPPLQQVTWQPMPLNSSQAFTYCLPSGAGFYVDALGFIEDR